MSKPTIAAVVVTYNQKKLLLENLTSLLSQNLPPDVIYIIDNLSDDGTPQALLDKNFINELPDTKPEEDQLLTKSISSKADPSVEIQVNYIRKKENDGGAGGFYKGIKLAHQEGYDWIWVMDDDTIPQADTLEMFMTDVKEIGHEDIIIGSTALWQDETYHPMNFPVVSLTHKNADLNHLSRGILPVTSTSFVSLLINSTIVDDVGYPIKKFFIWNDDFEYTRRITNKYNGYFSLRSKVLHKTERKHQATEGYSWKYYYEVRNKLWLIFKLDTFSSKERIIMFYYLLKSLKQHFNNVGFHKDNLKMIGRAIFNGFFSSPN